MAEEMPPPPTEWSPRCPADLERAADDEQKEGAAELVITHPLEGDVFLWTAGGGKDQQLALKAHAAADVETLSWFVDGEPLASVQAPFTAFWRLSPGNHKVGLGRGRVQVEVAFRVE